MPTLDGGAEACLKFVFERPPNLVKGQLLFYDPILTGGA
jgi:hypothetical protein